MDKKNSKSVVALVFSIVSIMMFFITILIQTPELGIWVSAVGLGLAITAIVFGVKGKKIKYNKGIATAGFVIGIIGTCMCAFSLFGCTLVQMDNAQYDAEQKHLSDLEETTKDLEETTKSFLLSFKETCKNNYKEISYNDLSRNPENYKYECIHFKGKVIQVMEDTEKNKAQVRMYTKLTDYSYIENYYDDDAILIDIYDYDSNNRLLEDDIIDVNGIYGGIVTYESVIGANVSVPSMTAMEYTVQ